MDANTCPRCNADLVSRGSHLVCRALVNWQTSDQHVTGKPCPCDYSEIRTHFEVPRQRLATLVAKIAKLANRAARFGFVAPTLVVGASSERRVKHEGVMTVVEFVDVTVCGEAPKLNGWEFCAVVDHDGEENILRGIETTGMPERYRNDGPTCEHCKVSRRRTETFVLRNVDGRWARVGRSCLADFLGHASPAAMAASAEYLLEALGAAGGEEMGGYAIAGDPAIETFCSFVALAIRTNGWTPRSAKNGEATADVATKWLWAAVKKPGSCPMPEPHDYETAEAALAWARELEATSDYEHNLRAASKRSAVAMRNEGLTAAIVAGFLKAEAKRREPHAESKWVGTVGARFGGKGKNALPALRLTVTYASGSDNQWGGTNYFNVMRDEAGNVFKWTGSTCLEIGETYDVTGTVKEHTTYKDTRQTVLTRCQAMKVAAEGTPAANVKVGQWRTRQGDDLASDRECKHIRIDKIDHKGAHYALFVCGSEQYSGCVDTAERLADWYPVVCGAPATIAVKEQEESSPQ